jgi:hypothetical protein
MRTLTLGILCLLYSVALIAQTPGVQPERPAAQDGGTREVLESIVIPPIPNQPFSATFETEGIRFSDGGTITFVNERPLACDSKERICQPRMDACAEVQQGKVTNDMDPDSRSKSIHSIAATPSGTFANSKPTIPVTS